MSLGSESPSLLTYSIHLRQVTMSGSKGGYGTGSWWSGGGYHLEPFWKAGYHNSLSTYVYHKLTLTHFGQIRKSVTPLIRCNPDAPKSKKSIPSLEDASLSQGTWLGPQRLPPLSSAYTTKLRVAALCILLSHFLSKRNSISSNTTLGVRANLSYFRRVKALVENYSQYNTIH